MILSGAIASSGTIEIPATILMIDGGSNNNRTETRTWWSGPGWWDCSANTATYTSGAPGGSFGTRSLTLLSGTSYTVTVGGAGGGQSSFASLRPDTGIVNPPLTDNIVYYWQSQTACNHQLNFGGWAIGGAGGPNASSSWDQSSGQSGSISEFSSIGGVSPGGGGMTFNDPYGGSFSSNPGNGTYGRGRSAFGFNEKGSSSGAVVIRYSDSLPLPTSGSYTSTTVNGFRQIVCAASTTLSWG